MIAHSSRGQSGRRSSRRRGVVLIESAIVYSVLMMLILGTIVMGLGVFRYQQIASLAREASRWASVHGPTYQSENSASAPTDQDVYNATVGKAVILTTSALTFDLDQTQLQNGTASVKVTYTWTPEAYFSPITMSSTAVMPVTY